MTLTVHHLENSRSQRLLWLLEELGLEYQIKRYSRHPQTMLAPQELKALHPLGKSPLLQETDGAIYAESGAIVEYVLDKYDDGRLRPASDHPDFQNFRFWLHYSEGSLMPLFLLKLILTRMVTGVPFFIKPIMKAVVAKVEAAFLGPQLDLHLSFINNALSGKCWILGDKITAADMQLMFPLEAGATRVDMSKYPNIMAYIKRAHGEAAYIKALERGGPYAYAS